MLQYLLNNVIAFDQQLNALCGGSPDETLSAYSYRKKGWRYKLINKIFFWQKDHCRSAYVSEVKRKHLPKVYSEMEVLNGD